MKTFTLPADTQQFLRMNPLPPHLAHFRPVVERLPLKVILSIGEAATLYGLGNDGMGSAMIDAIEFQQQDAWRCPICFHWRRHTNLVIFAVLDRRIEFFNICASCEQKYPTTEALQEVMGAYARGQR